MWKSLKIPTEWKCKFRPSTLIAIAAGLGAACGYGLLDYIYLLLPLAGLIFLDKKQLMLTTGVFALCLTSGIIHKNLDSAAAEKIPHQNQTLSGTIICIDRRACDLNLLPPLSTYLCEVETQDAKFTASVIFTDETPLSYGEKFTFSGVIIPARPAGLICSDGEISGELPPRYGDRPLLIVREYSSAGVVFTFFRPFFIARDFLLRRLVSNFDTPEAAEMAAQLFLGASQGMSREDKKNFVNTGTIHLFSISGLHVTLVAGIILLLLRPVPFAWRYRITALLTLFYVLCSGAPLPAVRAGTMVIVWCLLRSILVQSLSWDTMMWTWAAFALLMPESTGSLSAQYSFGITAALIMAVETTGIFRENYREILVLMPPKAALTRRFRRKFHLKMNTVMYLIIPVTAFAAGCGMSLYRQNLFAPGSILTNLVLVIFTPILFGAMFFKMIFGAFIPLLDQFGAFALESSFFLLSDLTAEAAKIFAPLSVIKPPLWSVFLYYLFFFSALGLKSIPHRMIALCGMVIVLFFWQFSAPAHHRFIAVSYGSNSPAMLVLIAPDGHSTVIDVPDRDSAAVAGMLMKEHGTLYASIYFSGGTSRTSYGVATLPYYLLDAAVYEPGSSRKPTEAFLTHIRNSGIRFFRMPGNLNFYHAKNNEVICRTASGFEISSRITDNGRLIEIKTPEGKVFREILPWCSLPVVWQCDLK